MIRAPAFVVALTRHAAFPLAVLVLAAMVLGLAPILVRLTETGPAAAGFWRFVFALPLLTLLTATQGSGDGRGVGTPSHWMLLAGLFFVLDLAFWHYGIVMTSVANATVLCNLTPVVVTLFAWVMWRERPGRGFVVALALALAGAFAMAAGADGGQGTDPLLGDLFSLSVAVWYAGYFLAVKAARRTAGALRVTFWATLAGVPLLWLVAWLLGEDILPAGPSGWWACAGLGLMHVVGRDPDGVARRDHQRIAVGRDGHRPGLDIADLAPVVAVHGGPDAGVVDAFDGKDRLGPGGQPVNHVAGLAHDVAVIAVGAVRRQHLGGQDGMLDFCHVHPLWPRSRNASNGMGLWQRPDGRAHHAAPAAGSTGSRRPIARSSTAPASISRRSPFRVAISCTPSGLPGRAPTGAVRPGRPSVGVPLIGAVTRRNQSKSSPSDTSCSAGMGLTQVTAVSSSGKSSKKSCHLRRIVERLA